MPWGCLTGIRPTLVAYEEKTPDRLIERYYVSPDKAMLACRTAEEELRLTELMRTAETYLRFNVSTKHVLGLLAVDTVRRDTQ